MRRSLVAAAIAGKSSLLMPDRPPYYLTTPIYYVNARPHLGTAYSTIVTDTIARYKRAQGFDVFFLTGTDEHGQKIQRSAKATNCSPQEFVDKVSAEFRALWDKLGLSYTDFIRTTEPRHKQGVQRLFTLLKERGYIYKGAYTGQYCVTDEAWVDVGPGEPCPDCGRITETVTEENYFFKLSAFERKLLELYEQNPDFIRPETRRNEVLSFVRGGLRAFPRRLGVLAIFLFAGILAMTSALFFVLPRTARAALERFVPARYHLPGFANEVTLGQLGEIKQSSAPVMHIQKYRGEGLLDVRWRGAALTEFDGKRWFFVRLGCEQARQLQHHRRQPQRR